MNVRHTGQGYTTFLVVAEQHQHWKCKLSDLNTCAQAKTFNSGLKAQPTQETPETGFTKVW